MKFFLGKSSSHHSHHQQQIADRLRLYYKDFYEFNNTVLHGFPANPTCLAFDNKHRLLAIGTKNGSVQVYGQPGVEFHHQLVDEPEIIKILFLSKYGQILCMCSDFSFHLLQLPTQPSESSTIKDLCCNESFVTDENEIETDDKIVTTVSINENEDLVFVGLKNGSVRFLNAKDLTLKDNLIKQEDVLKSIADELKFKPGSVEVIEEQPGSNGKILIGYTRCLIALWDTKREIVDNYFLIEQQLEHLSWNRNSNEFITCHNDGSYNLWNCKQEHHDCKNEKSKLPNGPFPCKAIKKIFWNSENNNEFFIFNGGMQRSSYGDKETVSVMHRNTELNNNQEKTIVFDFTSKVVDFVTIFPSDATEDSKLQALVVLTIEEIVVIDLQQPEWPQFKLPYLACLHSSPITCSQYYSRVSSSVFEKLVESGKHFEAIQKYSKNPWPIDGGIKATGTNDIKNINLLITGHEDGTIRFWDASTTSLKHLYTVYTSKLFDVNEDDIALMDGQDAELTDEDDECAWPPFRKVGQFDPYSDDPRLAIRKLTFCTEKGLLAVGGTAGQLILFDFKSNPEEYQVKLTEVKLLDEKDTFVWKGHGCLPSRRHNIKFQTGYQPTTVVQIHPPAAITALTISTCWQVISIGTAHGFCLFDYLKDMSVVAKSTLKPHNMAGVMGGDALISRRKSFKKSLRESFRRLRRSRSQKSKRKVNSQLPPSGTQQLGKIQEINRKFDQIEPKPVERSVEAKSPEDMMGSMVRYLYFCSAPIISNQPCPTFWVGTNAGIVFIYVLIQDSKVSSTSPAKSWQLAKEVQIKHKAPIIFIRLVDFNGMPIFENNQISEREKTGSSQSNRILICSEEQLKIFNLPNFKTIHKFKLTAHEGARVRRLDMGKFSHRTNAEQSEYSLLCLTNLGDVNIFSPVDFKRRFQHHFIKKEDIHGITSLIFTNDGEGFYLRSSSEYQRFSLSAKKINYLECYVPIEITINEIDEICNSSAKPEETNLDDDPIIDDEITPTTRELQASINNTLESILQTVSINDQQSRLEQTIDNSTANKLFKNGSTSSALPIDPPNGSISVTENN